MDVVTDYKRTSYILKPEFWALSHEFNDLFLYGQTSAFIQTHLWVGNVQQHPYKKKSLKKCDYTINMYLLLHF